MRKALGWGIVVLGFALIASPAHADDGEFDRLMLMMCGSFSSAVQAEADTNYYDIRLEMDRIWAEREDGGWIYVEQAVADHTDRPYRQRVYWVVEEDEGVFRSAVYELPDPSRFVGADPAAFSTLTPDSLSVREGCAVRLLKQQDGAFAGSTGEATCTSTLRGASYAHSEVRVTPDGIASWDRGFDADGEQVWGAVHGPYIFDRLEP